MSEDDRIRGAVRASLLDLFHRMGEEAVARFDADLLPAELLSDLPAFSPKQLEEINEATAVAAALRTTRKYGKSKLSKQLNEFLWELRRR